MTFDFFDFSRYRTQLMGISILVIMLFHCGMLVDSRFLAFGYVGVEFFLVISAIGIYFSLSKSQDKKTFYKKRLYRILPTYFIVAVPFFMHGHGHGLDNYLMNLFGLCILKSEYFFWFIWHIIICYLIAPFYFRILKYKYAILIPFITLGSCYCLGLSIPALEIALNRFAIFFLGLHLAKWVHNKKQIQSHFIIPICILALFLIIFIGAQPIYHGTKRVTFFFLSIPSLMAFILLLKHCPSYIHKFLIFIGGITLELYMLHERITLRGCDMLFGHVAGSIISFPVCIVLAFILNGIIGVITRKLKLSSSTTNR